MAIVSSREPSAAPTKRNRDAFDGERDWPSEPVFVAGEISFDSRRDVDLRTCVEMACILEVTARKAGNVHRDRDFEDLSYLDFLASAIAIGPILEQTQQRGIGPSILDAIVATRRVVGTNTNLGIVLLLTPLCHLEPEADPRRAIATTLDELTMADARAVYQAIREATPGGMGKVDEQDIEAEPTIGLVEAMRLAAGRDTIARQYANGFADLFEFGVPALLASLESGASVEEATIWTHLQWMARFPDTLIARKRGIGEAAESATRARRLLEAFTSHSRLPTPGLVTDERFIEFDQWLRAEGNGRNPGASADLVTACLFWALRTDRVPIGRR